MTGEDVEKRYTVTIRVYEDIENVKEIKEKLMKGELQAAVVNPALVFSVEHVLSAAHKSLYNARHGQLKTRSLYTELLYSLFPSRSIREALKILGVQDGGSAAVLVTFGECCLDGVVKGRAVPVERLRDLRDVSAVRKLYKVPAGMREEAVSDFILTKMAAKELFLS